MVGEMPLLKGGPLRRVELADERNAPEYLNRGFSEPAENVARGREGMTSPLPVAPGSPWQGGYDLTDARGANPSLSKKM